MFHKQLSRLVVPLVIGTMLLMAAGVSAQGSDTWSAEEIKKGTGVEQCTQLAQLPKKFTKPWKLGFINPNKAHSFWGTVSQGMNDAAKFYNVTFNEMDSAGGSDIELFETMLLNNPDVVGTHNAVDYQAVAARALDKNIPYIGFDNGPTEFSPYVYGIPNGIAGTRGAELLIEGVEKRLQSDWKGRELFFLEFTHNGIPACVTRTGAAAKAFKEHFKLDDKHVIQLDVATGKTDVDMMLATLTAHPQAVFAMIPCWDGLGIAPYNAAVEAKRDGDVMLVTLGGDKPPADLLLTKPKGYYGYIEFQPFCEGWGWVESALAIAEGVRFQPYQTRRAVTQADIDQRYKELYGTK
jgi:ABC-type sugar transport system substrate-binding protein